MRLEQDSEISGWLRRLGLAEGASAASDAAARAKAFAGRSLLAVALVVAAVGIWWMSFGRGPSVTLLSPTRGSAAEVVYATGVVEPVEWAKVSAPARLRIVEICHCEGEEVKKGRVLARLDSKEEQAKLSELNASLRRAEADADRLGLLAKRNAVSRVTYEQKLTEVKEAAARVDAQKDRLADLDLKAPMDGVVLRRDGEVGEIAGTGANDVLFWVGKPRPMQIVADVNEEDIAKVEVGQTVLLRHEGFEGEKLTARVDKITPKGDPTTKTFRVYLLLPDDSPLKIGMSVEANIVVREVTNALLVPAEAIGNGEVLTVADGRAHHRALKTGIRGTRMVEVLEGIGPDARIISPYRSDLAEGARVRASESAAKAPSP
ncbi:MAG: efflux RND transporter periplasmic adaptor subunit [Hyphomicrobiaceae bacterium]